MSRIRRTLTPVFPAILLLVTISGCRGREPVPEGEIRMVAENHGGIAIRIIREDPFPWTGVTFTINRLFHYHRDIVEEQELLIPYEWFRREDGTVYVYDPYNIRLRVTANEGTWTRESGRNR